MSNNTKNFSLGNMIIFVLLLYSLLGFFSFFFSYSYFEIYERTLTHKLNFYTYFPSFILFVLLFIFISVKRVQFPKWTKINDETYNDLNENFISKLLFCGLFPALITVIFCFFMYFIILFTNHSFSNNQSKKRLKGKITHACYSRDSHITVVLTNSKDELDFTVYGVEKKFKEKETFEKDFQVGYWGILYNPD
jgi:NADH:ubiquinone oxidoreductase subunit 5 (subunit L)/multisubunit Na+/H+ antiporter MnhA subunit